MDIGVVGRGWDAGRHRWNTLRVGRCRNAGDQRCNSPGTRRTSSEGFDSSLVVFLPSGFGFFLRWAGVDALEAVSVIPLVAAASLFGFVLLDGLIFEGILSMGAF